MTPTGPQDTDVEGGFDAAARRYDLLTALNPGYHAALRDAARRLATRLPRRDDAVLLDLGCGSGLSTKALLTALPAPARVLGVDASAGMLDAARAKTWPDGVDFRHGRAQDLPAVLADAGVTRADGALAAYLLRNIPAAERDSSLRSMHDALAPGAPLVLHEYSVAGRPFAQTVWTAVCLGVVLPLATVLRGNPALYRYLWRSVLAMDSVAEIESRLARTGFVDVERSTVPGWAHGILHTIVATRPAQEVAA